MKKTWAAAGLVGACALCCAPLLWPVLAGAGLAGFGTLGGAWLGGLSLELIACVALPVLGLAGLAAWAYRQRQLAARPRCGCASACDRSACAPLP